MVYSNYDFGALDYFGKLVASFILSVCSIFKVGDLLEISAFLKLLSIDRCLKVNLAKMRYW